MTNVVYLQNSDHSVADKNKSNWLSSKAPKDAQNVSTLLMSELSYPSLQRKKHGDLWSVNLGGDPATYPPSDPL
jgi:hypothetical protein